MNNDPSTQQAIALPADQARGVQTASGQRPTGKHARPKARRSTKSTKKAAPQEEVRQDISQEEINFLTTLYGHGRITEAAALARSLTVRFPLHGFGWKVLGAVLQAQSRTAEAFICCQEAANLMPQDAEALCNLAANLDIQNRLTEAAACLEQVVALKPDYAPGLFRLGSIQRRQGQLKQAETSLRRALALDPGFADAHVNLAITLQNSGRITEAINGYRCALKIRPDFAPAYSNLLFCLSHDLWTDPQQLLAEHLAFGEQFEAPLRAGWQSHSNTKDPERCLQVGFVSADLYSHSVANFLEPVLEFLAKKQSLSLHAFYTNTIEDAVTQRLRTYFPHWHAVTGLSDAELANKIRADGIDILIDLSGHTAGNRLLTFARKPAPVQVSWMGYPGTTGLQAMDYLLCDQFYIPEELAWQFTEKLAWLPASCIFLPSADSPPINALPSSQNDFITFGSFNRADKLNDATIALWCLLLQAVPNARMMLAGLPSESQHGLNQRFAQNQIDPDRLTFCPRTGITEYLGLHHQVDICLDTFPYGGGTTTAHAGWMGVPTLTLASATPASRSGATFMSHWGLKPFIATSIEDFVNKGRYWSEHIAELAVIRSEMRMRFSSSALGRPEPFASNLDAALREMWQRWCEGLPPAHIGIKEFS